MDNPNQNEENKPLSVPSTHKNSSPHNKKEKALSKNKTKFILTNNDSNDEYYEKYQKMAKKVDPNKKLSKAKKIILIVLCVILALILIAASTFAYLYFNGKSRLTNNDNAKIDITSDDDTNSQDNGKTVTYKNIKYTFDNDITTILCIGVDKDTTSQQKSDVIGNSGQADALYLLCIDNVEKKYTVLSINRDSMSFIDLYDANGEYAGEKKLQLCLSYAYGDGKETSCKNTVKAVSRLLYNIPINSYYSINKAAIPLLNDIIDGVEVPEYDNDGNATGNTIYLEGQAAYKYIQYRDISKLASNSVRQKRQTSYIKAFAAKFIAQSKKDLTTPLDMYNTMSIYSTTNIEASDVTYLATNALTKRTDIHIDYESVPGKVVKGANGYAEYNVDNDKLLEVILKIFYDKVETTEK